MVTPQGPDRKGQRVAKVVAAVLGVLLFTAASWVSQWVDSHPVSLIAALCVALITLGTTVYLRTVLGIVQWTNDALATTCRSVMRPRVRRVPVALLVVFALVVTAGLGMGWWTRWGVPGVPQACAHPAELRVLTSVDGLGPTRALARRYERWTAGRGEGDPGCPTAHVFVYAAPSAAAATSALAAGWRDSGQQRPLVSVGPRPDVWLPESTVDVRDVRRLATIANLPVPIRASTSIGSSRIVLATRVRVPGAVAAPPTWQQLLSAIRQDARPALLAPGPKASSAGLLAAAGYLSDPTGRLVPLSEARGRVRAVSGAAPGSNTALLCQWAGASGTSAPDSVITSDQAWRLFIADDRVAGDCPGGAVRSGGTRVVPDAAPVLDHPFVEFTWSGAAQRAAVHGFRGWLTGSDGLDALKAAGLDPPREGCVDLEANACVPSELDEALELYLAAQQPGQVLLVLDASGSMGQPVAGTGTSRFGLASRAVTRAVGQVGPADKVGLWTFPAANSGGQRRLVGIAAGGAAHRERIDTALRGVRPDGGTPLFDAVVAGMREVGRTARPTAGPRAVVVLTDGEDSSGKSPAAVREQVRRIASSTGARLFLIATGDASCGGPQGLRDLAAAGMGECFDADLDDRLVATVDQLFDSLWKGQ